MKSEVKETKSAGGIVMNQRGNFLVVSQRGLSWSFPKGHIDPGEDALTAAKREIYEESGVTELEFVKEMGTYQRYRIMINGNDNAPELKIITMFLFTTNQEHLQPVDPDNPEARWATRDEVVQLLTHQKDKEFFLQVTKYI